MSNRINLGQVIGATGQNGQDGARGEKGEQGDTPYISGGYWWIAQTNTGVVAKGNEWFYGDAVPTSQGVNGDLYLRSNGDVYKKESGVWVFKVSIKGVQGEQGERGETALTFDIGSVATGDTPSVVNSGTAQDIVLDFVLPKGEKGDKGDTGDTSVIVGGFVVNTVSFDSDPQGQIDGKLDNNFGSQNAGKWLQIDSNGQAVPTTSSAEDDVVDGYYSGGNFYEDSAHTIIITGAEGKIYIDVAENTQYRWNGTQYVPLSADLSGYPTKAQAVGSIVMSINSSTYVLTVQAKNVNGENVGTAQTVDLPLESVVVNGSYNSQTKKVVLTLQNGSTIEFSIADLVSGLQNEITAQNKLSADLVDDTSSTNKFTNATEKATWNAKADASALAGYLPLAGGTLTGALSTRDIVVNSTNKIAFGSTDSQYPCITKGTSDKSLFFWTGAESRNMELTSAGLLPKAIGLNAGMDLGKSNGQWRNVYCYRVSDGTNTHLVENIENNTNKVTSLSSSSTDTQYPSAKAVYDYVEDVVGDIDTLLQDLNTGGGV